METFKIFGKEHILIIIFYIFFIKFVTNIPNFSKKISKDFFGKIIGYTLITTKLLEYFYKYFYMKYPLKYLLPLHICNFTLFFVGIMLIKKSYRIFRFSYFWSVGAIAAILTPDLTESFPNLLNISFFFTHFLLIAGVIYSIKYYCFSPKFKDVITSFGLLNAIMIMIFPINFILDTNFMYLRERPLGEVFWFLGGWPVYIIWFDIITFILFILFYIPFKITKRDV